MTVLATNVEESDEQWRPTARQKRLYLGEFQHNYFMIVSLHDGDHDGVVRICVDLSCVL